VVVVTPAFDATFKAAALLGVTVRGVSLKPPIGGARSSRDWTLDYDELKEALTPNTRMLVVNTPSSPLGKVFQLSELKEIAAVVSEHPSLIVLADEVYEKCTFDMLEHHHFASLPGMFERTVTLYSAGKTFSCTGWRIGYAIAPPELAAPMTSLHAATNFCVSTPLQMALARAFNMADKDGYFKWLPDMMQAKRDALCSVLHRVGIEPIVPEGGYFVCADATPLFERANIDPEVHLSPDAPLGDRPDVQICKWATEHLQVTAIPTSPFFLPKDRHLANRLVRFAFCKVDR